MPRSGHINPRIVIPDPIYQSRLLAKLINRVMKSGKKTVAQKQVYDALIIIKDKTREDPLQACESAIKNLTPQMEVRSRRVGGAAYQVPTPVKTSRGLSLALRWLVAEANKRPNHQYHTFAEKLAAEILDVLNNEGGAIQKKVTAHRQAEANRAFAHFRW